MVQPENVIFLFIHKIDAELLIVYQTHCPVHFKFIPYYIVLAMFVEFFQSLFCSGCSDPPRRFSKTKMMIAIMMYNLDYNILDRNTKEVINCDLHEFDEDMHIIRVDSDDVSEEDFFL